MPPRQQNKHLPRGLNRAGPIGPSPRTRCYCVRGGRVRLSDHLVEFSSSVINWSLVVITRLDALNPVDEIIMLMNLSARSTLLPSKAPDRMPPDPSESGDVMTGSPLFVPAMNWLPPLSTRPALFLNTASAS